MHPAIAIAAGFVVGSYVLKLAADAAARPSDDDQAGDAAGIGDGAYLLDYVNPWGVIERQFESFTVAKSTDDTNVRAFLSMIDYAEGTSVGGRDPYRTCYGYRHTITDLAFHPAELRGPAGQQWREWSGEKLPDEVCRAAGKLPGCVSTAAGRYQIIRPTWLDAKRALALTDFSPASQDAAAVYLIRKRGALDDVKRGRLADAVAKCAPEWASLPGAGYKQPERRVASLTQAYVEAGGNLA